MWTFGQRQHVDKNIEKRVRTISRKSLLHDFDSYHLKARQLESNILFLRRELLGLNLVLVPSRGLFGGLVPQIKAQN